MYGNEQAAPSPQVPNDVGHVISMGPAGVGHVAAVGDLWAALPPQLPVFLPLLVSMLDPAFPCLREEEG